MIHVLHSRCIDFLTQILVRFIKPDVVTEVKDNSKLHSLDFHNREIQKSRKDLVIGRRQYLDECKENGVMSSHERTAFFDSVRRYFATAASYTVKKFPLEDPLLKKAHVADMARRTEAKFNDLL